MSGMEVKGRRGKSKRTQNPNTAAVMNDPNAYKTFGNNYVWVPHPDEGFVVGEILAKNGADCEVQTEQGLKLTLPRTQLQPINPPKFDGVADMASLGYLNEPAVLHNLKQRYTLNQIYTYSGLFLVAVNPYKSLPLYGMDMVEKYKGRRREERDPHIYSVSDEAYRQMLMNKSNQSMLITGESGAGKTENTKKVIQYLTSVAGQHSASGRGLLEEQILQANPILESFGNAKTVKNNNSSRFGKFIEIQFNLGGLIVGSTISTYLLEKSRVVRQAPEERNFHIFYQLVQGASSEERAKYKLGNWKDYQYINQSDPFIEGVNDVKEFAETKKAMDIIGFTKEETDTVFKTTAAILHLGNLEFSEDSKHYAKVSNPETLNTVCQLLEIDPAKLTQALTNPNIVAGNEIVAVAQTVDQAVYNKDAMVKAVYGKLFDWIVKKINQTLSSKEKIATFIGVLDIAGFEIFQNNSFEQLCINYTNEKLQQFFNSHMFRKEQEEYIKEQIEWTFIDFGLDLQDTIDLIEKRNGIFALLDEQCLLGGSTEETLTLKFIQVHKDNAYFFTDQFSKTTFGIVHYAGDVVYDTAKWINKNVDPLHDDCKLAVSLSTNAIVRTFFPADAMQATAKGGNARGNARGATGAKFMTVSANYKQQLQTLMSILEATEPHFIRCIIPNLAKKPGVINNILVLDQLRCNGVLEGIRISRKGYPNRVPFEEFYRRYYLLAPKEQGEALIGFKAKAAFILQHIKAPEDQYKIGLTKIFLRTGQLPHLEELREARLSQIIICVQAAARGYLARKNYKKLKAKVEGIKLIQKNWRAHMDLRDWSWYGLFSKIRPLIGTMKKDEEFAAAKAEVDKLKKQLEEEAQRKKDLEAKKAEMEQLHAKLTKDIYSSQEEKQILNNKIGDLERKLNDLQVQVDKEARTREQLEKQKQQQDLALLERDSKIQDANSKFSNSTQEMERLKRELNELRNKLNEQDTKYTSLTNDKNGLERNYRELELRLQDELSQKDGLDKKTKNLNRNIEEYQNMIHKLEMEKTALEQEKKNVSGNLKTESGKAAAEAKAKEQALADYKKAQAELLRLQSELEEEKRQKAEFARKKTQLEGDLSNTSSNKEELERDKEVLARAKRGLESQLDELKFQMDHLNDNKAQLELLTQQQVGQLEDLKNQLNKANNNYTLLETAKTTLEKQIRENQSLYDEEINKAKQQLDTTKKRLEGDNASLKTALDDATNKGQKAERERVRLDRELKDTTSQLQAELANKNNLEDTIRRLEAEIKDLKAKLEDETRRRNEAERLNKKLQQDLLTLKQMSEMDKTEQEKIERLTAQLKREIDDLSSKLSEEEDEKAAIEAAKDDLDKRFNDLQRNFSDKTAEVKKLEQSLVAQRKESDESKAALLAEEAAKYNSQLESTKKSLQSQIGDLTTELNNAKAEVEKYKRKQKADSGKLGQQLTEVQAAYATASADVKRLSDDLTSAKTQLEVALQQKADLESQKRNADSQLQKERLRAEDLESEKSKLSDANRKLQKELADATERADDEESEKDEASARADELKSKADSLQRSLDAANARLAEADEERTRLRSELSNTKDNSTQANAKLAADLDAIKRKLESKVAELQKLLDAESSSKASLNEDKKDLQREIRDLQKENAALKQNQGGASTEQVRSLESQILKLQHELDEASRAKNGAEASQTSLQDKIRQLTMSLDEEARARKRAEEAKRKLTSDLESLQEDYEEVEESKTDLETAKSEIESQLAKLTTDLNRERDERQITQDSYQKLKREAEDALKQLKEEKSRSEEEKTRLKRKYEADIADMEEQVRRTFRNKSATSKSEKKLLRQVEELSRRVEDETRISQDAKDKASSLEKQMRMYSADIERLTTRARQAEQDKENVDKKTADLEEENEKIKRELNTLKSRYEQEARRRKAMDKKMRSVMVDSDDEF